MSSRIILSVMFGIVVLGLIGTASQSYAQTETPQNVTCDEGTISAGTFNSITVSNGSTCIIENVTVLKDIKILNTQFTDISDSIIEGNIVITNSLGTGTIVIDNSLIKKNVKMSQSDFTSIYIRDSVIDKNLILKDQTVITGEIDNSQIGNDVRIINNMQDVSIEFESNTVLGNMVVKDNVGHDLIVLENNSFNKNVRIIDNNIEDTIEITANTIEGNLIMKDNEGAEIEIGENMVGKNLRVISNQLFADMAIIENKINQKIITSKNSMNQFFIFGNTADSKIKLTNNAIGFYFGCGNNSPEPIMKKNTFAGQSIDECINIGI